MVLDRKTSNHNGITEKVFWLSGWVRNPLPEIREQLEENEIVLSFSSKFVFGWSGKETLVQAKTIKMNIVEVKET